MLRRSMTAQISVAITLVSVLLVATSNFLVLRMTAQELREGGEIIMLANLAILRDDLNEARFDEKRSQDLADRIELQLGTLHVALLAEDRSLIAASSQFEVPLAELPAQALAIDAFPVGITPEKIRRLQKQLGSLTRSWTAPDGRSFGLMLTRIPPPPELAALGRAPVLVALALELTQAREVVRGGVKIVAAAALLSALAAALLGAWMARRILQTARQLGAAASRISANALGERLALGDLPSELQESGHAFNRMLDRLEAAFKRLSEFSSDLAHDLRTPINNLLGTAQVALGRPRTAPEYRVVLESAVEDYERVSRLIENMLFLARADDARASIRTEWVDLCSASERLLGYFEGLAEERGVTVACELRGASNEACRVWADRLLLVRALGNLISNALRFADAGTAVLLVVTPEASGACTIQVSNQGPAIPPRDLPRVFDRLFRVDPSREGSASGSGLGLAIVKSIMDMHGGQARVSSGTGQRTVFTLAFPAPMAQATAPPDSKPMAPDGLGLSTAP